jgi:hypothetical protein
MPGGKQVLPGLELLAEQRKGKKPVQLCGFEYNTLTGRFENEPGSGSCGGAGEGFARVLYVPASKQYFIGGVGGMGTYDPDTRKCAEIGAKGPKPTGYDISACYDSKRNRIVFATAGLNSYDIATQTWSVLKPSGLGPVAKDNIGCAWGTNKLSIEHDAVNDALVVIMHEEFPKWALDGGKERPAGVYVYSPEANSWDGPRPLPADVAKLGTGMAANTCYDRELNAFFCWVAGSSQNPPHSMWVYRNKRAAGAK